MDRGTNNNRLRSTRPTESDRMKGFLIIGVLLTALTVFDLSAAATDGADRFGTASCLTGADLGSISEVYKTARVTQCCNCCYGGFVPSGSERPCLITTPERCFRSGWVCYVYVLCP